MKFITAQNFTSLAELMRFYSDSDEIVFKSHSDLDEQGIAEICRHARRLVHHLTLRHGNKRAAEIAEFYGITVIREGWQTAEWRIAYLAECSLHPAKISLNAFVIKSLAGLMPQWANENELKWFTETQISEVATAHELCHLIEPRLKSSVAELTAHAFTRAFTSLPFSPLLYDVLLRRLLRGKGAGHR